jgi:division protein CdvB (Snf7/Vps24/ESCRT-III family)
MENKQKKLFNKCVRAQEAKDSTTSTMYANECAQVRKMIQTIISARLALEQVVLRLETIKDFGDMAAEIAPVAKIVRLVQGRLAGVIPEVSQELGMIGQTLDSLVLEVGEATSQSWSVLSSGEDAEKILAEATVVAEQNLREGLPTLPTTEESERGVRH